MAPAHWVAVLQWHDAYCTQLHACMLPLLHMPCMRLLLPPQPQLFACICCPTPSKRQAGCLAHPRGCRCGRGCTWAPPGGGGGPLAQRRAPPGRHLPGPAPCSLPRTAPCAQPRWGRPPGLQGRVGSKEHGEREAGGDGRAGTGQAGRHRIRGDGTSLHEPHPPAQAPIHQPMHQPTVVLCHELDIGGEVGRLGPHATHVPAP